VPEYVQWNVELPWLGLGFLHFVHTEAAPLIFDRFRALQVQTFVLEGSRIHDRDSFHEEAARTFGFPDWYGRGWDALNDVFRDVAFTHPAAIIWNDADQSAAADLKTFAEAAHVLYHDARHFKNLETGKHVQIALFYTGRAPHFTRPDPGDT
jgi:RNAse (barnase) inhibitor barstar